MLEQDDCFELSVGAERSVSIRLSSTSSQPTRRRVHNMESWLEAFTLYPRVPVDASPDRAGQLLAYQAAFLRPTTIMILTPSLLMTSYFARHSLHSPTSIPGPQLM